MARLIVCLDGTWNSAAPPPGVEPTNGLQIVRRVAPVAPDGLVQTVLYEPGLGVDGLGSHFAAYPGWGLSRILRRAYARLAETWAPGDELFLIGVSRGAFLCQNLAHWLDWGGLPQNASAAEIDQRFELLLRADASALAALPSRRPVPIRFLGAFDTVAALGLPLAGLRRLTRPVAPQLGNRLPANVAVARHALAVEEDREPFRPEIWTPPSAPGQSVEQLWLPGGHADVCGGFGRRELSDYALLWMMAEAERAGLAFDPLRRDDGLRPDPSVAPSPATGVNHLMRRVHRRPLRTWPETERLDPAAAGRGPAAKLPTLAK